MIQLSTFISLALLGFKFRGYGREECPMDALSAMLASISKPHPLTTLELHFSSPPVHPLAEWTSLDDALLNPSLSALKTVLCTIQNSIGDREKMYEGLLIDALPRASARGLIAFNFEVLVIPEAMSIFLGQHKVEERMILE